MKKALISKIENYRICEVRDETFEISEDFYWIDVPDDTTTADTYNPDTKKITKFDPINQPGFAENGWIVARTIAYKSVGEQLDMMYKELQNTGTVSSDGPWATHIATVKSEIPKDDPAAVVEWNKKHLERLLAEEAAKNQQ
jgi:hypothetical protein